jgi:hypothetical protein
LAFHTPLASTHYYKLESNLLYHCYSPNGQETDPLFHGTTPGTTQFFAVLLVTLCNQKSLLYHASAAISVVLSHQFHAALVALAAVGSLAEKSQSQTSSKLHIQHSNIVITQ